MEPIFNFAYTFLGCIVLTLVLLGSVALGVLFNSFAFLPVVVLISYVVVNAHPPKEETTTVNTQESSQVKVKENTMNLNCTALENGEYLCKKPK